MKFMSQRSGRPLDPVFGAAQLMMAAPGSCLTTPGRTNTLPIRTFTLERYPFG